MQGLMILARTIYKSATAMVHLSCFALALHSPLSPAQSLRNLLQAMLVFFILITLIVFSTLMSAVHHPSAVATPSGAPHHPYVGPNWTRLRRRYNIEGPGVMGSLGLGPALDVVYDNETRVYLRPDGSPTPFESILSTMWSRSWPSKCLLAAPAMQPRVLARWRSKGPSGSSRPGSSVPSQLLGRSPRPRERASAVKNEGFATLWPCRYCIITMTTVGYGDAYPVTVIGQAAGGTGLV